MPFRTRAQPKAVLVLDPMRLFEHEYEYDDDDEKEAALVEMRRVF